jgi:protein O-GlcNAc transferase
MMFPPAFLWLYLGSWLERKGLDGQAASCFRSGAAGSGKASAEAGFRLAKRLLAQDRNREAVVVCSQALLEDTSHARAWCALGAAQRRLAEMAAAREAYERALAVDPDYAQAWSNLGEWQLVQGDLTSALASVDQALKLDPLLLEALNNRVATLYELGRFTDAEATARQAIEQNPDQAALHVNMGNVLLHSGKARAAVKSFRRALECDPACLEAHMNLATMFGETEHIGETLVFIEKEIAVKGESAQRLASLALAQHARGDFSAAEASCSKVLEMQPANVSALVTLAACKSARADHRAANLLQERALVSNPNMPAIRSNIAFNSTYLPDLSVAEVFECHLEWARRCAASEAEPVFTHDQSKQPDRPLRIGYVSGDFGAHPVGFLLRDVIRHHDRELFEVHCFSMMRKDDDITVAIRENSFAWHDVLLSSDDEVAREIHEQEIDILVDLAGHTAYNRLPSFVLRPAPVQATWIGYFHSTGLEQVDYFITDPYTSPAGSGQLFAETPVWLPHSRFCYAPPVYAPEVAATPALGLGRMTFGCFNRVEKLVDPVIDAWVDILNAVAGSRLLLKAGALQNEGLCEELRQRFADRGLDVARLELQGPSSHPDMLAQYAEIDIALDPFPFNGGMTTLEALWMGVPVVSLIGQGVVGRQSVSALCNLGLAELAFADLPSYIDGAVKLAEDVPRLAALRQEIRPRMAASPICQPVQFTRDLEALYRRMWQAWCRGEKLPSAIAAGALS